MLSKFRPKGGLNKSASEPAEVIVRVETKDKTPHRFTYTHLEGDPTRGGGGGSLAHTRRTQLDVGEIGEALCAGWTLSHWRGYGEGRGVRGGGRLRGQRGWARGLRLGFVGH